MKKLQLTNIKEDGNRISIIHGECFIKPVDSIPEDMTTRESRSIIGHSKSGHHHVVVSEKPFEVMAENDKHDLYIRLFAPAEVIHQKTFDIHETQILAPGDYAIYHKTEYDPFKDVVRAVFD